MKKSIKLLSHASVLISIDGLRIVTDPWFLGSAFNDGWELFPAPILDELIDEIKDVDIIWISHEHPDHLHFPTLKYIKEFLSADVTIAFQSTNSDKVFESLKKIGYSNFLEMPHRKKLRINSDVELATYAHRHLDSALAVFVDGNFWLLNVNDTVLTGNDTRIIRQNWGSPIAMLHQFSIAGYNGIRNTLKTRKKVVMQRMCDHHLQLAPLMTIPIASYMRYSCPDNYELNAYANTPFDAETEFSRKNLKLVLLSIQGDALEWNDSEVIPKNIDAVISNARDNFLNAYKDKPEVGHDFKLNTVKKEDLNKVIENRLLYLKKKTTFLLWNRLNPIIFKISDWDSELWSIDFKRIRFKKLQNDAEYDLVINSQPLEYSFKMPFGFQTLGVSGRYKFNSKYSSIPLTWKLLRMITSLDNAGIHISFQGLLSRETIKWMWARRQGLRSQIHQQFSRFFRGHDDE